MSTSDSDLIRGPLKVQARKPVPISSSLRIMFSECLLLFDDVRNFSSQNVLPEDGFWTSKIYPLHPMFVLLALFLSSRLLSFTLVPGLCGTAPLVVL